MSHLSKTEQDAVTGIAQNAGSKLLSFWRSGDPSGAHLEITVKPDGSNVTNADLLSNGIIVSGLKEIFPADRILSEELPPDADIDKAERVWIVDPLDGTRSFIEGRDDFSVLIALTINKRSVFGICFFPARSDFYLANENTGANKNSERLSVSSYTTPRDGSVYIRDCSIRTPQQKFPGKLDSGLAFAKVANGELDGTIIKLNRLKQWDLAAPAALITEAGGKITDEHGKEILYSAHSFNYGYFVASNGLCHEALLKEIIE